MRSLRQALGLLTVLLVVPTAVALPAIPGPEDILREPTDAGGLITVAQEAAEAAGIEEQPAAVPIVAAPVEAPEIPALAIAGLAIAGLAGLGTAVFFFGGARFVTPAEVLQNDVRQRIYAHLKARVGANLKQVTDDLGLTTTNAIWHLRKLEEAGLIHSRRFNGYKVFYPAEGGIEARRISLGKAALQNGNAQEVFEHVVGHPGAHQREIARALGVNHGTVRWHLKKLMHAELIVETRRGKASSYEPTQTGLAALREIGPRLVRVEAAPAVTAA